MPWQSETWKIGTWNPAREVWETDAGSLFSEHSEPFSETWPGSGMTRAGEASALPTLALPISDSASSSSPTLLVTPLGHAGSNGGSQHPDKRRAGGHGPTLADQAEHLLAPTPTASDGDRSSLTYGRGNPTLAGALLPTPNTSSSKGAGRHGTGGLNLQTTLTDALVPPPDADPNAFTGPTIPKRVRRLVHEGLFPLEFGDEDLPPEPGQQHSPSTGETSAIKLLPTPAASLVNDGEEISSWEARRDRIKAEKKNGNGMGTPLTIAAQRLAPGASSPPPSTDGSTSPG